MNIKRFFATSSREALGKVRSELGPDAVIISNRSVDGGNEILAVRGDDMDNLISNKPQKAPEYKVNPPHDGLRNVDADKAQEMLSLLTTRPTQQQKPSQKQSAAPTQAESKILEKAASSKVASQQNQEMSRMMAEIRQMRDILESQLTEISWGNQQRRDPSRKNLLKAMLNAGFGAGLSRQLVEKLPAHMNEKDALSWAQSILSKNLNSVSDESNILDKGGVFALVGPTGVGKTTTTAKLAARFVMKHGTSKLALITTDAYRIGGHEQLRIYGKILGVMVHAVKDEADLKLALEELKNKHTILIDTVGVSQRDRMVAEQIAMLSNSNSQIKKILCLNATNTSETLTDVVNAYRGKGLDGCVITKVDEAATMGNALDVVIQEKLKVYYLANGQRVPEDLHLVNKTWLMHHTFNSKKARSGHFEFNDDELPFLMANRAQSGAALEISHA